MSRWRRAAALLLFAALGLGHGERLGGQSISLNISALTGDSTSPAPVMTISAIDNRPELGPYNISLVLSLEPEFRAPFYNSVIAGEDGRFTLDSLLPERTRIYFRARLSAASGLVVAEQKLSHPVRSWLRLVSPLRGPTTIVTTRTPRFVWSSPAITFLWLYDLSVFNTRTGTLEFLAKDLSDTSYVFPDSLESNASYHWQVHARTQSGPPGDSVTITSPGTFVIGASPTATVLYSNFPNPFSRNTGSGLTCFWFDLARPAVVKLTIYDIRLHQVRRLIPGTTWNGTLLAGEYGRENVSANSGCDERLAWDGKDANGRAVPPGVYLAVFDGDGVHQSTKIVLRAP